MNANNRRSLDKAAIGTLVLATFLGVALLARGESLPDLPGFSEKDRSYWAFQPVVEPALPGVANPAGIHNPIDLFVRAQLEKRSLVPAPPAAKRTLIRRATFDLTGLPPTPEEVFAFLADESPSAYQLLIDRLLASPRYGEHMARHWMDLVRYADSDGFKGDKYRPDAWRYRDYVIRAFNGDIPYDRFVREQLAGGEMYPGSLDAVVATGFLRHTPDEDNQKDVRRQWTTNLQDVTEVTGETFLGLGLRCARCHDHKFDPVLQRDYYRLQAFFTPMLPVNEVVDAARAEKLGGDGEVASLREAIEEFEEPHLIKGRQGEAKKFPDYLKPMLRKSSAKQTPLERQYTYLAVRQLSGSDKKTRERMAKMEGWQALRDSLGEAEPTKPDVVAVLAMGDVGPVAPPTFVGGDPGSGQEVQPGFLSILDPGPAEIRGVRGNPDTTGRRSALAHWIASPENPLTARVMVNRIWQWHFGDGIVATSERLWAPGDGPFPPRTARLAGAAVCGEWLERQGHAPPCHAVGHLPPGFATPGDRDHGEARPCSSLPVARQGAPPRPGTSFATRCWRSQGIWANKTSGPSADGESGCRSVFVKSIRNVQDEVLKSFDGPDMFSSCSKRYVSTTALQSLLLMNGKWANSRAQALGKRLQVEPGRAAQVRRAYTILFARLPHAGELAAALEFLEEQKEGGSDTGLTDLCHVLLNTNEFAYVD